MSGGERLSWAVLDRPEGQGLLTVCNHVSALDDPLVLAAAIPAEVIARPDRMRWTMCAAERCFHRKLLGSLLKSAKVLPIERGAGLGQPGVVAAERRLARGDWVHIFPEGTRAADPERLGVVRRGVGRLYVEACERARRESPGPSGRAPLLLPFVHRGMERINSRGKAGLGVGHEVEVVVGEPIDLEPLLDCAPGFPHFPPHRPSFSWRCMGGAKYPVGRATPVGKRGATRERGLRFGGVERREHASDISPARGPRAAMASRGATRDELYEAVAEEVAHSLRVLHAGLFGYDPEPHPRRHLTAAEGAAASRALFSASASAGPWAAAYESFPPRPHPGFAASAAASPAGASSSGGGGGVVGSSKSLGGLGWGRRSSGCVLGDFDVASEAGAGDSGDPPAWGRGGGLPGGTDAAAAFFAPPQDDLWWYAAKTQALQRAGRGTVPFAAAGALAALVEGVDGRSCWSGAAAAAAARGDMASC